MIRKLLPVLLLVLGSAAGVGAGVYLRPAADPVAPGAPETSDPASADKTALSAKDPSGSKGNDTSDYAKLNNQFVVPVVKGGKVISLVVLTLSLEIPAGTKEAVFKKEPKMRNSMLQVLFDHANHGGFDGAFTEADRLDSLRAALREVTQRDLGVEAVRDVLILEIARQDY